MDLYTKMARLMVLKQDLKIRRHAVKDMQLALKEYPNSPISAEYNHLIPAMEETIHELLQDIQDIQNTPVET